MTALSLILCEGPHDQAFIIGLACACGGWNYYDGSRWDLPDPFNAAYPTESTTNRKGWPLHPKTPGFICKNDRCVEIRPLEGVDSVLGKLGRNLVEARIDDPLCGVAFVVDANDKGVENRLEKFRFTYSDLLQSAKDASAGSVVEGSPRVGIWVAPDNRSDGNLLDTLVTAGDVVRATLIAHARSFIQQISTQGSDRFHKNPSKAIAGAAIQVDRPGASLASALISDHMKWFSKELDKIEPFAGILLFLELLTAP